MVLRLAQLSDPVTRGWATVAAGSAARLGLGFVASILIARSLGPESFAVFAVLAATAGVAGAVADFGLSDAGVRRVAEVWPDSPVEASARGSNFFWLRAVAASIVVLAGCALAWPLAGYVLGLPDPLLLVLALLGVVATALGGAATSLLQASGHFGSVAAVITANSGLTALLAVVLAATGTLNLWTALAVLGIGTSLASLGLAWRLLSPPLRPVPLEASRLRVEARILVPFALWLWAGAVLATLASQLDLFMVNRFLDPATVGFYALAMNLASKAEVANHSLYTVLLPSAASLTNSHQVRAYLRRGLIRSGLLAIALLPLFPLAGPLIALFYGSAFLPAAPLFQLLLAAALLDLFATPAALLAFTYKRPRLLAAAEGVKVVLLGGLGVSLIPLLGPAGAVLARLVSRAVGIAVVVWGLKRG